MFMDSDFRQNDARGRGPGSSVTLLALIERLVMLDARDAQARHAGTIDRALPAGEFLETEPVTLAGLIDADQAAIDGGHDLGLPAHHPAGRGRIGQRVVGERFAERTDDLGGANFLILDHSYLKTSRASCCGWPSAFPSLPAER